MKDGKPHGKGKITFSSGAIYEGEVKNGIICGQGTYIWPDRDKYVGEWKDGKQHGQGTFSRFGVISIGRITNNWGDLIVYVGEYKYGKKNGYGKSFSDYEDDNGKRHIFFEGEWKDNVPWNGNYHKKFGGISEHTRANGIDVWPEAKKDSW